MEYSYLNSGGQIHNSKKEDTLQIQLKEKEKNILYNNKGIDKKIIRLHKIIVINNNKDNSVIWHGAFHSSAFDILVSFHIECSFLDLLLRIYT